MTVLNSGTQVYNQTVLNSDRQVYNEVVLNVYSSKCVVVSELKYCGLVQSPVEAGLFVPRAVWPKKQVPSNCLQCMPIVWDGQMTRTKMAISPLMSRSRICEGSPHQQHLLWDYFYVTMLHLAVCNTSKGNSIKDVGV